jgi:4-amino-4-deoxy-L-arabinose transferase-like glycosyltransferase
MNKDIQQGRGATGGDRAVGAWSMSLLLAVILVLPRVLLPGRFLTPDEVLFLDHARDFLRGLTSGDLSPTLGIGYPGVTVAWVGALGLWLLFGLSRIGPGSMASPGLTLGQFLDAVDVAPLPYYVAGRLATGLFVALLLWLTYRLLRRWWRGPQVSGMALVAVLLLALDPFLTGYSRLFHIAIPLALLMFLTVLAWLIWLREGRLSWLLLTGLLSGLALLTKSTALLLMPLLGGLALLDMVWEHREAVLPRLLRLTVGLVVVALLTGMMLYLLWPAMWLGPVEALDLTFGKLWLDKDAGEGNLGMYWMGRFVEDPGVAFYPVALLLKISPLLLLGLLISMLPAGNGQLEQREARRQRLALWVYAAAYLVVMTVASKKSVRYLLPGYVALAPLAAWGWMRVWAWVRQRWLFRKGLVALALLTVLLLGLLLPYAPQFFSYYNPLVLGWRWAPHALLVGWGEGLGNAARWLNEQPDAENARVTAWYDWTFAPFFIGQAIPFSAQEAMTADYSVLYINQVQRDIPDPNLIDYFGRRQPQHMVRLNGIDYAWVYPPVAADRSLPEGITRVDIPMGAEVVLEGYAVRPAQGGDPGLWMTLYWRCQKGELPDYFVYARAVTADGAIAARTDSPPVMGFYPTSRWQEGQLVADEQVLLRPMETPPGSYRLEVGMYDPQTWAVLEPAAGMRGDGGGVVLTEVTLP